MMFLQFTYIINIWNIITHPGESAPQVSKFHRVGGSPYFWQCPNLSSFFYVCALLGWLWAGNCNPVNFSFIV